VAPIPSIALRTGFFASYAKGQGTHFCTDAEERIGNILSSVASKNYQVRSKSYMIWFVGAVVWWIDAALCLHAELGTHARIAMGISVLFLFAGVFFRKQALRK
jgi:hypothetical protein